MGHVSQVFVPERLCDKELVRLYADRFGFLEKYRRSFSDQIEDALKRGDRLDPSPPECEMLAPLDVCRQQASRRARL